MEGQKPQVGIGVLVFRDGKVLLGRRKGSHGSGQYGGPGGHLEYMESPQECAEREIREETGITVCNIRFLCLTNLLKRYVPKHYIDIGMVADWESGELPDEPLEPEKCEYWDWYDLDDLPTPLFGAVGNYIQAYKTAGNLFPNNYFTD